MMQSNIVLSICIPTYNRRDLVYENVQKILQYKGDDIEVIVNDNASDDGTREALMQIKDERLKIYQNEVNIGAGGNYIRVLLYATGKYVMCINDRDYVDCKDIKEFVERYRHSEYDVIMCIDQENLFHRNVRYIEGRTSLLQYYNHPGHLITGRIINEKIIDRIQREKNKEYCDERNIDLVFQKLALCLYALRWDCYKQVIRQPSAEKLAKIPQLRGESTDDKNFFTPEGKLKRFNKCLDNPYIHKQDIKAYIIGNYRVYIYGCLSEFYFYRNDSCTKERYHYDDKGAICWFKIAAKFYKDSIEIFRRKKMCSYMLVVKLGLITLMEYFRLCKIRIIRVKKRFWPEPWFISRNNR